MAIDRQLVAATIFPIVLKPSELDAFVAAIESLPQPAIRLRPEKPLATLPFANREVPWHSQGRFVASDTRPAAYLEYAAGEYYIQDAASLLALALLRPRAGELICDLCAAPGGKSTGILEALAGQGSLVANEAVQSRRAMLEFNLSRHGSNRYLVTGLDPDELAGRLPARFDAVLVDAPCSGQSLVGRGKQSLASFTPKTVDHCAARQARILDAAAELVRPGGRLVYSTCTFAFAENEAQIELFLQRHGDWRRSPQDSRLSAALGNVTDESGLRLWPHRHGCGGAFAARVERRELEPSPAEYQNRVRSREPYLQRTNVPDEFGEWGELSDVEVQQNKLQCFAWPRDVPEDFVRIAASGPEVAFRKGNTWFPSYALAMRRDPYWIPRQRVILDDESARKYLRGEVLAGDLSSWGIAAWHHNALGWLKGNGRQMKNHLPKAGRIGT